MTRDSRSKPDRAETALAGSVHESGGAEGNRPISQSEVDDLYMQAQWEKLS